MLKQAQAMAYFKRTGKLIVAEHDSRWWVTDAYMLVAFDPKKSVITDLLADYNLPVEPMVCEVFRTIRRRDAEPPSLAALVPKRYANKSRPAPLQRWQIDGRDVLVDYERGLVAEVWETPSGVRVPLNREIRTFVDALAPLGQWSAGPRENGPLPKLDKDGNAIAMVMPLRNIFDAAKAA